MNKLCPKCNTEKEELEFTPSQFLKKSGWCKVCNKAYSKLYRKDNKEKISQNKKEYNETNKDKISLVKKKWYQENKIDILSARKEHYQDNKETHAQYGEEYRKTNKNELRQYFKNHYENNKEEKLEYQRKYYENNKDDIIQRKNKYEKDRRQSDPLFRLRKNCSRAINRILRGTKNNASILDYLPYTIEELKQHLEKQFDDKMTWDNYGRYWHIDHIIPQSKLLYASMIDENFKKCWALENLHPLEAIANIKKSNKII